MKEFPSALTAELKDILGRPCFTFISWAQAFRAAGIEIPSSAEDEQAFFIHRLLTHWFKHGDEGWRAAAQADLGSVFEQAKAAIEAKKGDVQ
jgi:hypothetical protein